ncbi:MAG: hypothetical protein IGS39_18295 [Calothrix sp. C42_A2020_038]|nr:hypothetical protein [Calothrix sp. C42_A2020_038]
MFGFIKNLVKGNDNNFFLELKEEVDNKVAEAKTKVADAASKVAELTKEEAEQKQAAKAQASKEEVKTIESPASAPAAASSNGKMTRKEAAAAAKASKIDAAKKARAQKEAQEAKPKDPAELVRAAVMKNSAAAQPKETNFATKYLMTPSTNGRRRPGPNMNPFLEMARQVKTPVQK